MEHREYRSISVKCATYDGTLEHGGGRAATGCGSAPPPLPCSRRLTAQACPSSRRPEMVSLGRRGGGGGGVVNVGGVKRLTTGEEGHIRHDGSSRLRL